MPPSTGKVVSKARQARLNYQARIGRPVSVEEVAEAAGIDRGALTRLELGRTERFDGQMLARLCAFYGVGLEELLEYTPETPEGIRTPGPFATQRAA